MKILYLSTSDIIGGGARGAYRLHRGFLSNGVDSKLIVNNKYSDDYTVIGPKNKFQAAVNRVRPYIAGVLLKLQSDQNTIIHSVNILPSKLVNYINNSDADLVMLHWIGAEMISIEEIGKIKKKIVWRLADQWAFCGAEHYILPSQDPRYIEGYSRSNRPKEHKGIDIDQWTWKRKVKHWSQKQITIVTGSKWLAECAEASYLFSNQRIEVIPSGLDITVYKPLDKNFARKALNLPLDKKIILFGSISATSDTRKGFHLLLPALQNLTKYLKFDKVATVIFGASEPREVPDFKFPYYYLSSLYDDWSLVLAYSAADVFVLPSMQDNLPYTLLESMSCGTPCVGFNTGGISDIIEHKINGYLAKAFDPIDFSNGIQFILENQDIKNEMAKKCRQKAIEEYDVNVQVKRYLKLFDTLNISHDQDGF